MSVVSSKNTHIVWIYDGVLSKSMDSATWLKTVAELRQVGWQVTLIAAGPARENQINGIDVFCVPQPEIFLLRQIVFHLRVLGIVYKLLPNVDVILFHELSAPWMLLFRIIRMFSGRKLPLIVMDTRSVPMLPPEKESLKDKMRRAEYAIANLLGNRFADGRLAITQRMADVLHVPANKLWGLWPSGADVEHFTESRSARQWPKDNAPIKLIYHGTMDHERNLMVLSRAVARANQAGMSFILTLVGDGREREDLEKFAAQANGAICLIPSVPHAEIPKILAQSHIGVIPFPDEEKFRVSSPIKLFEYMAAGMPILATRITCNTDVISDEKFVFWAEDATEGGIFNALRSAWLAHDSLGRMGQSAFSAVNEWTWKASAKKLKTALEKGLEHTR